MSENKESETEKESFSKPSLLKIARKAGITTLSHDCYDELKRLSQSKLKEIITVTKITNRVHDTKTIMKKDVYLALSILGENVPEC